MKALNRHKEVIKYLLDNGLDEIIAEWKQLNERKDKEIANSDSDSDSGSGSGESQEMTADDIAFLKDLQHELNTQDNGGNADPVYWSIVEKRFVPQPGGSMTQFICEGDVYMQDDFLDLVNDYVREDGTEEQKKEWATTALDDKSYYDITGMADELGLEYDAIDGDKEDVIARETGCFLTKRAAEAYIKKNGYHHSEPRVWSAPAWRNHELERFLKLFRKMDLDSLPVRKEIEKPEQIGNLDIKWFFSALNKLASDLSRKTQLLSATDAYKMLVRFINTHVFEHLSGEEITEWNAIDKIDCEKVIEFARKFDVLDPSFAALKNWFVEWYKLNGKTQITKDNG